MKYSPTLLEYFEYDENFGSCLKWKKVSVHSKCKVGEIAGSLDNSTGYWVVYFKGVKYRVHLIIWYILNGEFDTFKVVDHINRVSCDNKISNLRLISPSDNSKNKGKYKNNSTGITGVTYLERISSEGTIYSKYCAAVYTSDNHKVQKTFSCQKYGKEVAFDKACDWRHEMFATLNYQHTHGE